MERRDVCRCSFGVVGSYRGLGLGSFGTEPSRCRRMTDKRGTRRTKRAGQAPPLPTQKRQFMEATAEG